jgi:alpha-tubulin suppressor-like RCC1 family protein
MGPYDGLYDTGGFATCARQGASTVCWGDMFTGVVAPTVEPALAGAQTIGIYGMTSYNSSNRGDACILDATGSLACFGDNVSGQLGNGRPPVTTTCGNGACDGGETCTSCPNDCGACPLSHLRRTYTAIAIGRQSVRGTSNSSTSTVCGIRPDAQVECWGRASSGQTGADPAVNRATQGTSTQFTPFVLPGLAGCTAVTVSDRHACAICGGEVSCWGDNTRGGVGDGAPTTVPIVVPHALAVGSADDPPVDLVSGTGFSCARTQHGHAYCWGASSHGALGGGAASASLPAPIQLVP